MPPKPKEKEAKNPENRSWRQIRQDAPVKNMTDAARRRRTANLLKASGTLFGLVALLGMGTWAFVALRGHSEPLVLPQTHEPLKRILFETDGVLTHQWLGRELSIPRGTSLMEVDIFAMKRELEMHGQVKEAVVERRFPDALFVGITEAEPRARIAFRGEYGIVETLLVTGEGDVYQGFNYNPEDLSRLPYLADTSLKKDRGGHYRPIGGMPHLTRLFSLAWTRYPDLAEGWRVVSLQRYYGENPRVPASLIIRQRSGPNLIFSLRDMEEQLEKLVIILNDLESGQAADRSAPVEAIDLSLDGPAVVSFTTAANTRTP